MTAQTSNVPETTDQQIFANGNNSADAEEAAHDSHSSSLSDIEDGADEDHLDNGTAKIRDNDSEAETERLHITPQKVRMHKDVLVTPGSHRVVERSPSKLAQEPYADELEHIEDRQGPATDNDDDSAHSDGAEGDSESQDAAKPASTSIEAALGDTSRVSQSSEMIGKKRKRSRKASSAEEEEDEADEPTRKRTGSVKRSLNGENHHKLGTAINEDDERDDGLAEEPKDAEDNSDGELSSSNASVNSNDDDPEESLEPGRIGTSPIKSPTERRRAPKDRHKPDIHDHEADTAEMEVQKQIHQDLEQEAADEEAENTAEDDTVTALKDEEEVEKRKTAMDTLGAIEKHFAAFRDKLFDERSVQLSNELELLSRPEPSHPDFLAMLQCLDERRDEKIKLEQTKLDYKIKGLQIKSVAEKSQIHSQYFQTVRDLREGTIENLSEQWYQIQKGRRGWEGRSSDYMLNFPTRRSQQITHQTAYNTEVSLLAGVRKYVGFPAAPPIEGIRSSDVEDDFKAMGIKSQPQARLLNYPQSSSASTMM
ncbi:MAG: hypothetical protein M4579_003972 [Chaenotheca gracillima]|nr:MAG: hypothetical protein M4579_003972 [Chaenotheca gracillima]